jgi:hypothetical protein
MQNQFCPVKGFIVQAQRPKEFSLFCPSCNALFSTVTWKHVSQQAWVQSSAGEEAWDGTAMASAMHSTAKVLNPAILILILSKNIKIIVVLSGNI